MNIIDELKNDLTNQTADLSNTLRKVKIFSAKLQLKELRDWTNYELNGYDKVEVIPLYRIYGAQNYGTFSGSFNRVMNNVTLPTYNLPDSIKEFAEYFKFRESISELESMKNVDNDSFHRKWSQEAMILARDYIKFNDDDYVLVDAWQTFSKSMIIGIIDNVKNKLLDFLLDIEDNFFYKTNDINSIDKIPNDEKQKIFNINIIGNNNTVASGKNINQTVESKIVKDDMQSLKSYLKQNNLDEEDLTFLEEAIINDGKLDKQEPGKNVKGWIGNMILKASNGIWKVALDSGSKLLIDAISNYYGWS